MKEQGRGNCFNVRKEGRRTRMMIGGPKKRDRNAVREKRETEIKIQIRSIKVRKKEIILSVTFDAPCSSNRKNILRTIVNILGPKVT
jgi:hypothetical protein